MNDRGGEQSTGIEVTRTEGLDWGKVWLAAGTGLALGVGASVAWAANYGMDTGSSLLLGLAATGLVEGAFLAVTAAAMKEKKPRVPKPRGESRPAHTPPPREDSDITKAIKEAWKSGLPGGGDARLIKAALKEEQRRLKVEKDKRRKGLLRG